MNAAPQLPRPSAGSAKEPTQQYYHEQELPLATQPMPTDSSFQISSLYPSLLQSSFMPSYNALQQPLQVHQQLLGVFQQMQAEAWAAAVASAPNMFQGSAGRPLPSAAAAAVQDNQAVDKRAAAGASLHIEQHTPAAPSRSHHQNSSPQPPSQSSSFHTATSPPLQESPSSPIDLITASITIPTTPSQIPMAPQDYISAVSRAACLASLPPPAHRCITSNQHERSAYCAAPTTQTTSQNPF